MPSLHELLTEQFRRWEERGRGWRVFSEPVSPEPPFAPFRDHSLPDAPAIDDGRRPTFLSGLVRRVSQSLRTHPAVQPDDAEVEEEPEPQPFVRDSLVEIQVSLPSAFNFPKEAMEGFLQNLVLCREPVAFELVGLPKQVTLQLAAHPDDSLVVRRQLQAHFHEGVFQTRDSTLEQAWATCGGEDALVVEFGLAREFLFPLASGKFDPFVGLLGALGELQPGEMGLFQVLFQPVHHPWAESILRSVSHGDRSPFFVDAPELADAAKTKVSRPLYAAVVRIAVQSQTPVRTVQMACDLAASLRVFAHPHGNELIPLENVDYPFEKHIEDTLCRQSRRPGMLLNTDELIGFVHLPSSAVRSPSLVREIGKTKAAPEIVQSGNGVMLGQNLHAGRTVDVRLTPEQRVRHMHVVGASGTGKSTLLFQTIQQDINNGEGIGVLDPHGDLIERILGIIPPHRMDDVVLVDPSDEEFSVGFNILSAHSDFEKNLLASDLVSVFQRLSTSWGDQMGSVLQNAILAFLESDRGGTLADLRRFLLDTTFRNEFLTTVRDPDVVFYWKRAFPQLSGNKSIGPVLTRLETFLSPKPIRYMVSQRANRLDFAHILDTGKIFLAKLPQGQMGKENAFLLGSLLVAKFQQLAMSRQRMTQQARRDFFLYIDEFQNFITPSMAEILSGARKYRLGLILAHQELRQLQRDSEVAGAVLSNSCTRIVFRVGDDDARKLAEGFAHFDSRDLQTLSTGQAISRVERSDFDFNLTIPLSEEPDPNTAAQTRTQVITTSREKYATARAEIEKALRQQLEVVEPPAPPAGPKRSSEPKPAEVPPAVVESPAVSPVPSPITMVSEPVAEAKLPVQTKPPPEIVRTIAPSTDLGMGGAQHKAIQQRLKREAEALGFRAIIEKEIADGSVDLVLERGEQTIACEITVTNTIDYEVGNIAKCLKGKFRRVVLICQNEDRLRKIQKAVSTSLGPEVSVDYFQPDQFIAELRNLASVVAPPPLPDQPVVRRGYKVQHKFPELTDEERKAREAAALKLIAESMQGSERIIPDADTTR